jgi:hypothetical protein
MFHEDVNHVRDVFARRAAMRVTGGHMRGRRAFVLPDSSRFGSDDVERRVVVAKEPSELEIASELATQDDRLERSARTLETRDHVQHRSHDMGISPRCRELCVVHDDDH